MTDYLAYIYEIQPDKSLKELHAIALVENEHDKPNAPSVYSVLIKGPEGTEDTGRIVLGSRRPNILRTFGEALLSTARCFD